MIQRQEAVGFVGAIVLHAAALLFLRAEPPRLVADEISDAEMTTIEVEPPPPIALAVPVPTPEPAASIPEPPPGTGVTLPTRAKVPLPASPVENLAEPEVESPFDPGAAAWLGGHPPPMPARISLGTGDARIVAGPPAAARQDVDPGRRASGRIERSIHDALAARDHDLGFDAAGALVAMAEDCVRGTDSPVDGRAFFEIAINADGTVAEVRLVAASEPAKDWQGVVASLRAAGRSRSVLWRRNGKPLRVRLEVSSRWVLPSGTRPGRPIGSARVEGGETWETPGEVAVIPLAPSGVAIGGQFDVSDIGARPLRDVHARIVKEESP